MEFVKATVVDNAFEAQLLETVLVDRGIPHVIRSFHDDVYGTLFQITKGWGEVQAPVSHRQEIADILEELRNSEPVAIDELE
jgi:hypothetical protein